MTDTADILARPELTLPPAEAALLREAYAGAATILEYGSGGSTVMAGDMPGKTVWSVESDAGWAAMMRRWFDENPARATVHIHHADVGPTKDWGMPDGNRGWRKFARYPLEIWSLNGFSHPDVVLVDGRFRVGCVLATLFCATQPVTLYFDDYAGRERYSRIEEFVRPAETRGRMARFDITPRAIEPASLLRVFDLLQRPF